MTQSSLKIGLAGCGKMGSAMVRAWLHSDLLEHIDILDPHQIPDDLRNHKYVSYFQSEKIFAERSSFWDFLILAIKPQTLDDFSKSVGVISSGLPVLSIMAGKTIASLEAVFGGSRSLVRAMPNTPASIGKGMTVAITNALTTPEQKNRVEHLLRTLGLFAWVEDETKLDAVTGLSGSGPAYVFHMIEAMANAGQKAGLPKDLSMTLARQTVIGAAALAEAEPQTSPLTLRENVTSPNGTTAAGLAVLMDGGFQDILDKTILAATTRSKELSK